MEPGVLTSEDLLNRISDLSIQNDALRKLNISLTIAQDNLVEKLLKLQKEIKILNQICNQREFK